MADITMPQLGETVTEGTVTRWLKSVGDEVAEDEVLFEVSTDKVDSEVPSPAAGYVAEILVAEGETVDVGARLAVITPEAPGAPEAPRASEVSGGGEGRSANGQTSGGQAPAPAPQAQAQAHPQAPAEAPAPAQAPTEAQAPAPAPASGADVGTGAGGQVLSPVVRRLLSQHQIQPGDVEGSGAGGRITRGDVLALVDTRSAGGAPSAAPGSPGRAGSPREAGPGGELGAQVAPTAPVDQAPDPSSLRASAAAGDGAAAVADDEIVPFSNIRRRTAEHMVRSKATSAHTLTAVEADFEGVERARRAVKDAFRAEEGIGLTYLPFVARAVADALREFPHLNASVVDDALVVHRRLHLGIAVDLGGEGLIVPVVHDADGKRLRALAREAADLAQRARSRRLTADDIAGGTFTITNPGPFGTFLTVPIINQPQVAILSTDGVRRRPVVVALPDGSEGIAIHSVGMLALSFDHRAVDGAYASRFLARLREVVETRDWGQEL